MNTVIFNFFFGLSSNPYIAWSAVFASGLLTYILYLVLLIFILIKARPLFLKLSVVIASGAGAYIVSKIMKLAFHVPRPFVTGHFLPLVSESGFSLPSSHATVFAALTIVAFSLNRALGMVFFVCTVFIGLSRMVIGVHYPFDVFIGFIIGTFVGLLFVRLGKSSRLVAILPKSL